MNRTKEKSDFAAALARLLDETNLFTRSEWADLLGVSESAISQWTTDATIPRPEHLYMIFDTLKGSDVPEGPLDVFRKMASMASTTVSPRGKRMLPTVWTYMTRPAFDGLSNQLATMTVDEQERLLESLFDKDAAKNSASSESASELVSDSAESQTAEVKGVGTERSDFQDWRCFLRNTLASCPDRETTVGLGKSFITPLFRMMTEDCESGPEVCWDDLPNYSRILIVAQPGCGKTTALLRMARQLLESERTVEGIAAVPIYIHLSCLSTAVANEDLSELVRQVTLNRDIASVLFLLDGVDEIPQESRTYVLGAVASLLKEYPQARVILTSRPTLTEWHLEGFTRLAIEPLSHLQMQRSVYQQLSESSVGRASRRDKYIDRYFYDLWERPDILSVLRTPLFLAISTSLLERNSITPFNASDILSQCLWTLLDEWDRKKNVVRSSEPWATPSNLLKLLSGVCFHSLKNGEYQFTTDRGAVWLKDFPHDIPIPAVLELLSESTGVLAPCADDEWRIVHKTFQEFLAAVYIVESCRDVRELLKGELASRRFQHVVRFASSLTNDASSVLQFILETDQLKQGPKMVLLADALAQPFVAKHSIVSRSCDAIVRWLEPSFSNWIVDSSSERMREETVMCRWSLSARNNKPRESIESEPGQYARQVLRAIHLARSGPAKEKLFERLKTSDVPVLSEFRNCINIEGRFRDRVSREDKAEYLVTEIVETGV